jgi:hypothetical protein
MIPVDIVEYQYLWGSRTEQMQVVFLIALAVVIAVSGVLTLDLSAAWRGIPLVVFGSLVTAIGVYGFALFLPSPLCESNGPTCTGDSPGIGLYFVLASGALFLASGLSKLRPPTPRPSETLNELHDTVSD